MKFISSLLLIATIIGSCSSDNESADAYGNFEATEIMVAAQASGPLLVFDIYEGQLLKAGQIVGYIDTTALDLKRNQLNAQREAVTSKNPGVAAQIAVLNQQMKNAKVDQQRIQNMFNEGAATQKQLDDINGQLDLIGKQIESTASQHAGIAAELKSMDAQIAQVNDQIGRSYITNPSDGTVLTKYAEQSEITAAGKSLYKLADLKKFELRAYLSGGQLAAVKIGDKVRVMFDTEGGQSGETTGFITWIAAAAEFTPKIVQTKEQRTNLVYAMKVEVDNTNGQLKIGMPGEVFLK
ncbi:MAG TPA: HlyD family efflux transporter periplasmic adaptor subunit [Chitinophagales bacterium]|nr:HlyD family efflux transporter periplasmic adaptor subunit [Chitinophagales bacterium]